MNFDIELTSTPITSHAGLAFIGEKLWEPKFAHHMETVGPANPWADRIPNADLAKTMVGLICCGNPCYDAAGEYRDAPYFPQALGIGRLPSPEILRQRIEAFPAEAGAAFRGFTARLLAAHPDQLAEEHHGRRYMPVHIDVTPMDNSGSPKEGVSRIYKKVDGYAPIFAYAPEDTPRLVVTDAGHDAAANLLRLLGQQMLGSGLVPGRKSQSKRLRTVLQNLIYMAGRVVSHARRRILRIFEGHGWVAAALSLARPPD